MAARDELRAAFEWIERELDSCKLEYGRYRVEAQVHGTHLIKVHRTMEISLPPNPAEKNGRNPNEQTQH